MSAPDEYRGPKFVGIMGHDNVSHNGSKTTVYFVQVQTPDGMFIVRHRYHEFKDFYDKLTGEGYRCPALPPKKFLGNNNKEFIEKRQQELANWLHLLCQFDPASGTSDPRTSEFFKEFMLTNKEPMEKYQGVKAISCDATPPTSQSSEADSETGLYNTPKTTLDDFELLKFEPNMARYYCAEITLALEHLHDLGVVYRDLKPENILFDPVGHVLLADFGLAKEGITDGAEGTNSMCGTPEYLPPEILDRDLYDRKIPPPFNPCATAGNAEETKNFEAEFTKMQINSVENSALGSLRVSDASRPSMTFQGFTYNTPNDLSMSGSVGRG
ncbi:unnamed protein product [Peronospora belbahrii]|uniref:PX domain-containing protein n=1 Tax=Peronospora belbahrii TaxID=622444 RepID=A0AAU9LD89_9STRA|nr:unnamed protein product [Peronospora belbahrii]